MNSTLLKIASRTLLSCTVFLSAQVSALDINLNLEDQSALTMLSDSDWSLLKSTAKDALNNGANGSSHVWKNSETSNAGVITILSTESKNDSVCRNTRLISTAGELTSTTTVNLCQHEGTWTEDSSRLTSTTTNSDSPSTRLNNTSTEINNKVLGETSQYCQKSLQNIEDLKGSPIRRSAAIDLHQKECLK